jgi:competence protein ComEA
MKKSTAGKLKSLIYPLAFILIIILSVLYKFVFKGSGDFTVEAFRSGKTAQLTDVSGTVGETKSVNPSDAMSETTIESAVTVQVISIYICGEVRNPGIYEAPKGVMLNEIIEDAGGLTERASVNNINLVYQIESNMSIYIPSEEEISKGFSGGDVIRQDGVYVWGGSSGGSDSGSTVIQTVNINTATLDELKSLPGIGEVTAQAIIDYRKNTPFQSIEDIKNVTGIGDSKYNRIKDYICV